MKVREIMTAEILSVSPHISAKEALDFLFKHRISGLPVIDANGKLVGMFTEKDVLKSVLPSYIEKVGKFVYDEDPKSTKRKMAGLAGIKVSQIMRKEVITLNEETSLCEVARIMLTQNTRRIPIVDKQGKIKGIIAREDIVKAFAKEVQDK